jgi:hypothetical protein
MHKRNLYIQNLLGSLPRQPVDAGPDPESSKLTCAVAIALAESFAGLEIC